MYRGTFQRTATHTQKTPRRVLYTIFARLNNTAHEIMQQYFRSCCCSGCVLFVYLVGVVLIAFGTNKNTPNYNLRSRLNLLCSFIFVFRLRQFAYALQMIVCFFFVRLLWRALYSRLQPRFVYIRLICSRLEIQHYLFGCFVLYLGSCWAALHFNSIVDYKNVLIPLDRSKQQQQQQKNTEIKTVTSKHEQEISILIV